MLKINTFQSWDFFALTPVYVYGSIRQTGRMGDSLDDSDHTGRVSLRCELSCVCPGGSAE